MRRLTIGLLLINLFCLPALGEEAGPAAFPLGRNGGNYSLVDARVHSAPR